MVHVSSGPAVSQGECQGLLVLAALLCAGTERAKLQGYYLQGLGLWVFQSLFYPSFMVTVTRVEGVKAKSVM